MVTCCPRNTIILICFYNSFIKIVCYADSLSISLTIFENDCPYPLYLLITVYWFPHTDNKWKCFITFLVNVTGRFPTKIVLASLSRSSSRSLDFLFFIADFLTRMPSSSSLLKEKQKKKNNVKDNKLITGTSFSLQWVTIRRCLIQFQILTWGWQVYYNSQGTLHMSSQVSD